MKDKKKLIKPLLTLLFSVVFILILNLIRPDRFITVNEISCKNQLGNCSGDIAEQLDSYEGQNLYKAKRQSGSYLKNEIAVEDFTSQFKLPGSLEFLISEKLPEYAITNSEKRLFLLLASNGLVLNIKDKTDLPKLVIDGELPDKGSRADSQTLFALDIIKDLHLALDVAEGIVKDGSLLIELRDNLNVIFPLEGDREILTGSLILLYGKIEEGGKLEGSGELALNNIKTIDLRYKNPVLREY